MEQGEQRNRTGQPQLPSGARCRSKPSIQQADFLPSLSPSPSLPSLIPLNRQLLITPPTSKNFQSALDIRADNRDVSGKLPNCDEEVAEKNEEAIQLDQEACQWPAEEDEDDSDGEGGGSF